MNALHTYHEAITEAERLFQLVEQAEQTSTRAALLTRARIALDYAEVAEQTAMNIAAETAPWN